MNKLGLIAVLGFMGLILAAAFAVLGLMRQPLGPSLELSGAPVGAPAAAPTATTNTSASSAAQSDPVKKTCGNKGVMDLLVLGLASPETPGERGADAIRLVSVDFDHTVAAVLALPPDLLVETPVLDEYGYTVATLTQTYWLVQQNTPGPDHVRQRKATQALAQTLLDNYGYLTEKYITVNQPVFAEMVDTLGGVQVDVPEAIQDVPEGWYTFEAGQQTMSGDQARDYVRLLNPTQTTYPSEWDRLVRQNLVLQGAVLAALDPANWDQLPKLVKDFRKLLVTDLSIDQLLDLRCMLEEVGDQVRLLEVPQEEVSLDEQGRMLVDPEVVRALIDSMYYDPGS